VLSSGFLSLSALGGSPGMTREGCYINGFSISKVIFGVSLFIL
jgi:hypothetical protein